MIIDILSIAITVAFVLELIILVFVAILIFTEINDDSKRWRK